MTVAVCFKCGSIKHGAFNPCPTCNTHPVCEEDFVTSLAMTDHYHNMTELNRFSEMIRSGISIQLDPSTRASLLASIPRHMLRLMKRTASKMSDFQAKAGPMPAATDAPSGGENPHADVKTAPSDACAVPGESGHPVQDGSVNTNEAGIEVMILVPGDIGTCDKRLPADQTENYFGGIAQALCEYVETCRALQPHLLRLVVSATPGGYRLVDISLSVPGINSLAVDKLRTTIEQLPPLKTIGGPVAFQHIVFIGDTKGHKSALGPPFGDLLDKAEGNNLEEKLLSIAGEKKAEAGSAILNYIGLYICSVVVALVVYLIRSVLSF